VHAFLIDHASPVGCQNSDVDDQPREQLGVEWHQTHVEYLDYHLKDCDGEDPDVEKPSLLPMETRRPTETDDRPA